MPYIMRVANGHLPYLGIFGNDYDTIDGTGVRDYIHVTDLAKGHIAALDKKDDLKGYHIFNLGTGNGTSVLQICAAFEKASGIVLEKNRTDTITCSLALDGHPGGNHPVIKGLGISATEIFTTASG